MNYKNYYNDYSKYRKYIYTNLTIFKETNPDILNVNHTLETLRLGQFSIGHEEDILTTDIIIKLLKEINLNLLSFNDYKIKVIRHEKIINLINNDLS